MPHIVVRNLKSDRVLSRLARHLITGTGWTVSDQADPYTDVNYYFAYFEAQRAPTSTPIAAFMTHRENDGTAKAALYDRVARAVNLRVVMNAEQIVALSEYGPTAQIPLPLELEHFKLAPLPKHTVPVLGVAGYTYPSGRKGESLFDRLRQDLDVKVEWQASGRGWPVNCRLRAWSEMPAFYQSLDLYICTATIEGGPMTTLEALACGRPVVIPDTVGIHPELPEVPGIWRYHTGDAADLLRATREALRRLHDVDPQALRAATAPHSVQAWVKGHREAFERFNAVGGAPPRMDWRGKAGIYVVAFGGPARAQAKLCISSARKFMPNIPVALVSDKPLKAGETHFIQQPDADIGGRIAKLKIYDLAPREWECVLYVDADTEFVASVTNFFDLTGDGWEFAICKDAHRHDTIDALERRNNTLEYRQTVAQIGTVEGLGINGGVWAFRRCDRVRRFFERWRAEWEKYKGRDQPAFLRAMYADPLRVVWLGNEWNTMITLKGEEYPPGRKGTAGILHHVGMARRWKGQVPAGKGLTDPEAWAMVAAYERETGKK